MSNGELETTFRGTAVDLYGVPFDDLVETLSRLQLAFRHLLAARLDRQPRRGPLPTVVREGARLVLRETRKGSFVAVAEIRPAEDQQLSLAGEHLVDEMLEGLAGARKLPAVVLRDIERLTTELSPDIEVVELRGGSSDRMIPLSRDFAAELLRRRPDSDRVPEEVEEIVSGRLLEVDWNDLTAEIHAPNRVYRVRFAEGQAATMQTLARQVVSATIGGVEGALDLVEIQGTISDIQFWENPSPDELRQAQGVAPFTLENLPQDEPNAESADEFLASIGR